MKTDTQFFNTLEDTIQQRGTIDKLLSDLVHVEIMYYDVGIIFRVKEISRGWIFAPDFLKVVWVW